MRVYPRLLAISQIIYNVYTLAPIKSESLACLPNPGRGPIPPSPWVGEDGHAPLDLTSHLVGVCERCAAIGLLAVLSPLIAGSAAVLSLLSRRGPLIAHRRVGWRGRTLWMLKLRTMWDGEPGAFRWIEYMDDASGPTKKHPQDPRVAGRFARFCRRHSIDELPQLWHVIRGEMALVGPRPVTASELECHYGTDADEMLQVRPGITGLWQVSGRNRLSYRERRNLDLEFVRQRSVRMHLAIVLRTIPEMWTGANSW